MPVCICGMHRSGTSMVSHALHACGLYLGEEEVLRHSAFDNPDGFWEDKEFVSLNDGVLAKLYGGWDLPPIAAEGWEQQPEFRALRQQALALVDQRKGHVCWGWKDPRSSLTLPFWLAVIPSLRVVICLRNPLEVAQSLQRRNFLSLPLSIQLWYAYNGRVLAATQPSNRIITHYEAFLTDPQGELRRLTEYLGAEVDPAALSQAAAVCKPGLRNHAGSATGEGELPAAARKLYESMCAEAGPLCARAVEQPRSGDGAPASSPDRDGLRLLPALGGHVSEQLLSLDHIFQQRVEAVKALHQTQIAQLRDDLSDRDAETKLLRRRIVQRNREVMRLRKTISSHEGQLQSLRYDVQIYEGRVAGLRNQTAAFREQLQELAGRLAMQQEENGHLLNELALRDGSVARLEAEATSRQEKIRLLEDQLQAELGQGEALREQLVQRDGELAALHSQLGERRDELQRLHEMLSERDGSLHQLHEEITARDERMTALAGEVRYRMAEIERLEKEAAACRQENEGQRAESAARDRQAREVQGKVAALGGEVGRLSQELAAAKAPPPEPAPPPPPVLPPVLPAVVLPRRRRVVFAIKRAILPAWALWQGLRQGRVRRGVQAMRAAYRMARTAYFDPVWYLQHNPDVAAAGIEPLAHYLQYGSGEERQPGAYFDGKWYSQQNPDVAAAGIDPYVHFVLYGDADGRHPHPEFNSTWYQAQYAERLGGRAPLLHYLKVGRLADCLTRPTERRPAAAPPPAKAPAPAVPAAQTGPVHNPKETYTLLSRMALDAFLVSGSKLTFPACPRPRVSVLIVLHNRAELTLSCLKSLLATTSEPLEVILVDNGSTDQTPDLLARLEGVKILRNQQNDGFSPAVNQAAAAATGDYLLLLNNDTQLLGKSVDVAAEFLDDNPAVGAVGGRILLLDGRLQEAGSIVWQDGSTLGYGRGADPYAPDFMFQRDVDFCSAAFLMTSRRLFADKGGFDKEFFPAYYEDVDYCVRLWRDGWRVVYHPEVTLIHYEFGSSASAAAAAQLMAQKKAVFISRHRDWLAGQYKPFAPKALLGVRARDHRKRILLIDDRVPHPWLGSGFPRANRLLRTLVELGHAVTLYPMNFPKDRWSDTYKSVPGDVEVMLNLGVSGFKAFLNGRKGYYDLVIVSRPHNMRTLRAVRDEQPDVLAGARILYDAEALFTNREVLQSQILNGKPVSDVEVQQRIVAEVRLAEGSHAVSSVSEAEGFHFRRQGYPVFILAHAIECRPTEAEFEARRGLLFVGPIHDPRAPNADSVRWLLSEIRPRLAARGIDIPLIFAGAWCPGVLPAGTDLSGVEVLGRVEDLEAVYGRARVFIAPTRYAAGIPHKVQEAVAGGLPAVLSSLLATQLGWKHGEEALVSDDPDEFADFCYRLHEDRQTWERLREEGLRAVERDCSPEQFHRAVKQALSSLLKLDAEAQPEVPAPLKLVA